MLPDSASPDDPANWARFGFRIKAMLPRGPGAGRTVWFEGLDYVGVKPFAEVTFWPAECMRFRTPQAANAMIERLRSIDPDLKYKLDRVP
jgi:hypothetical protein